MKPVWREPYIVCNTFFAGVLAAMLVYFGIFSSVSGYPVHAVMQGQLTSTGLQRALSELMHGNVAEALQFNSYSVGVFLFIVVQLVMRVSFGAIFVFHADKRRRLILVDAIISTLLFLCAFAPMAIRQILSI